MPICNKATRKLRFILFAAVKCNSLLMDNDEFHKIKTLKKYRQIISKLIQEHYGRIIDVTREKISAEFSSVVDVVECAVTIQQRLKRENERFVEEKRLQIRVGMNIYGTNIFFN